MRFGTHWTHGLAALVATLGIAAFAAGAGFEIQFPAGWSAPVTEGNGTMESRSPDGAARCRANSVNLLTIEGTQADLNSTFAQPLDRDTWADILSVDPTKIQVSQTAARLVDGRIVQFATITFDASLMGQESRGRLASHILPGRMVNVMCITSPASYEAMRPTLETVVGSLRPR